VRNEIGDEREFVSLNHGAVRIVSEPTGSVPLPSARNSTQTARPRGTTEREHNDDMRRAAWNVPMEHTSSTRQRPPCGAINSD
jgi:hypothetical protein